MRIMFLLAASAMTIATGAAFAEGDGGGQFPAFTNTAEIVTVVGPAFKRLPGKNAEPFPFRATERVVLQSDADPILPTNGQNGIVQTSNSLPRGFSSGTPAYETRQRVLAFLQRNATRQAVEMAQVKAARADRRG